MDLHRSFADWYRGASLSPTRSELEGRWTAVEATVKACEADRARCVELVSATFGLGSPIAGIAWFVDAAKEGDPTIPLEGSDNLLRTLAASTVASLLTSDRDWSDLATLVEAAGCQGLRLPKVLPGVVNLARDAIVRWRSANRRQAPSITGARGAQSKDVSTALTAVKTQPTLETLAAALQALAADLSSRERALYEQTDRRSAWLERHCELLREETDMLWWALGGWVADLGATLASVPADAVALVAGFELGRLTRICPAPFAMDAILDRVIRPFGLLDGALVPLERAIQAIPEPLLRSWRLSGDLAADLRRTLPISSAITLAAGAEADWRAVFSQECGIDTLRELPALSLAWQAYNERLARSRFA